MERLGLIVKLLKQGIVRGINLLSVVVLRSLFFLQHLRQAIKRTFWEEQVELKQIKVPIIRKLFCDQQDCENVHWKILICYFLYSKFHWAFDNIKQPLQGKIFEA